MDLCPTFFFLSFMLATI